MFEDIYFSRLYQQTINFFRITTRCTVSEELPLFTSEGAIYAKDKVKYEFLNDLKNLSYIVYLGAQKLHFYEEFKMHHNFLLKFETLFCYHYYICYLICFRCTLSMFMNYVKSMSLLKTKCQ